MNKDIKYIISNESVFVEVKGKKYIFNNTTTQYKKILGLIAEGKLDEVEDIVDIKENIKEKSNEFFYVDDFGNVYSYGEKLPKPISEKVLSAYRNDLSFEYIIRFWNKLKNNPSERSRDSLFRYLENNHFTILENGNFLAYKKVVLKDGKLYDCYSKSINNCVGCVVTMPRELVDDNPNAGCSRGLHVASYDFAFSFPGDVLIKVEVDPYDVVSVPSDASFQKIRVCRYIVLDICNNEIKEDYLVPETEKKSNSSQCNEKNIDFLDKKIIKIPIFGNKEFFVILHDDINNIKNVDFDKMLKSTLNKSVFEEIFNEQVLNYYNFDNGYLIVVFSNNKVAEIIDYEKYIKPIFTDKIKIGGIEFTVLKYANNFVMNLLRNNFSLNVKNRIKPSKLPKSIKKYIEDDDKHQYSYENYGFYCNRGIKIRKCFYIVKTKIFFNEEEKFTYFFINNRELTLDEILES